VNAENENAKPSGDEGDWSLEKRLRRLEEIVRALESEDLELERALRLFEEGVAHVRGAEAILTEAELKVEELIGNGETRPFEGGSEG